MGEFDLIARYFANIGPTDLTPEVSLGIGDDCALLSVPAGQQLALSIDTLVAGRHFPATAAADDIARRALAVSVSDLAAMGATPKAFTLAISLPTVDTDWLAAFSRGLREAADHYAIALIGGDTTQGPLSLTLQVHGLVPASAALRRSAAMPGDSIYVSGYLGDAAAALAVIENRLSVTAEQCHYLCARFYQPEARTVLGQALLGVAHAAIDISDGLLADLQHIAKASQVAAYVDSHCLPLSPVLSAVLPATQALDCALSGGDDYELCFTAAADQHQQLMALSQQLQLPISRIGQISSGSGVHCVDAAGRSLTSTRKGYQHFS
jgi:thiamine-monophosphate kinase